MNEIVKRVILISICLAASFHCRAHGEDVASELMRSTFKIQGQAANGQLTSGTVFVLGRKMTTNSIAFVLVTAAHVLDDIKSDQAVIFLRTKNGEAFQKVAYPINIRSNSQQLWIRHSDVDLAIMPIGLPRTADIRLLSTDLIATDDQLKRFEIRPGDELLVLGFPLGAESNDAGFPILRSGRVASYPITPTTVTKTFLLDFQVFRGNSGGPVLLMSDSRVYGGGTHGGRVQMVMGVVSQEMSKIERVTSYDEESLKKHPLALGVVVHGGFIRDLLSQLTSLEKN